MTRVPGHSTKARPLACKIAILTLAMSALGAVSGGLVQDAAAQTADKGERLFIRCKTCHEITAGKPHKVGPNLHGLFDRKAGMADGFKYSDAMRNSGVAWNDQTLETWLTKPTSLIQGTTMAFVGLPNKEDRDALIAYLHKATQ
nr:cytochrome c family protein [Niveispirillum sp. SYP-B3756]